MHRLATTIFPVVLMVVMAELAWSFGSSQSIWVDETTQLSGLEFNPVAQVRWLAGRDKHALGVPDDRAPPLSYWLGWGWSKLLGLTEESMRWFGIACVCAGLPGLWLATRRIAGTAGAAAATTLMAVSPNVISMAPEIRSYPLFLALGCWGCLAFVQLLTAETRACGGRSRWRSSASWPPTRIFTASLWPARCGARRY